MFIEHDGFLISSPEYNSSITGVLKNTIDWVSRSEKGAGDLSGFKDKVVGLMSASPGGLGGLRSLLQLRAILSNIGCLVLPNQKAIPQAHQAFDDAGQLKNPPDQKSIEDIAKQVASIISKIKS